MKFLLAAAASLAVAQTQPDLNGCVSATPLCLYSMTNWDRWFVRSTEEVHSDHTPDIQDTKERWDLAYSKATDYLHRFNLTQKVRCFCLFLSGSFLNIPQVALTTGLYLQCQKICDLRCNIPLGVGWTNGPCLGNTPAVCTSLRVTRHTLNLI